MTENKLNAGSILPWVIDRFKKERADDEIKITTKSDALKRIKELLEIDKRIMDAANSIDMNEQDKRDFLESNYYGIFAMIADDVEDRLVELGGERVL